MNPSHPNQPEAILAELSTLKTIEHGTLSQEYRARPAAQGSGLEPLGPYYKHQCWEKGRNLSRRVPAAEVSQLQEDLRNGQRFEELTSKLSELAIVKGREQRAALVAKPAEVGPGGDLKKNWPNKAPRKSFGKPKPSSRKSRRESKKKV
jgi:hypothetical protein